MVLNFMSGAFSHYQLPGLRQKLSKKWLQAQTEQAFQPERASIEDW